MRACRMAEDGHLASVLGDAIGIDDIGWVARHVAAPGVEVSLAPNEGSLLEDCELVIVGHELSEALHVALVDAVDEAVDHANGFQGHGYAILTAAWSVCPRVSFSLEPTQQLLAIIGSKGPIVHKPLDVVLGAQSVDVSITILRYERTVLCLNALRHHIC